MEFGDNDEECCPHPITMLVWKYHNASMRQDSTIHLSVCGGPKIIFFYTSSNFFFFFIKQASLFHYTSSNSDVYDE